MNQKDLKRLDELNRRFPGGILTGFKIVGENTVPERVVEDIRWDIRILNSTDVENKYVYTISVGKDFIDIRCRDNGTYISYFFTEGSGIDIRDILKSLKTICDDEDIILKIN
ncbi:hypothetical protein [Methanobrevibacter sp.]